MPYYYYFFMEPRYGAVCMIPQNDIVIITFVRQASDPACQSLLQEQLKYSKATCMHALKFLTNCIC